MSYTTVKIPTEFIESTVDKILKDPESGFNSRAEVIKAAVREFMEKTKKGVTA